MGGDPVLPPLYGSAFEAPAQTPPALLTLSRRKRVFLNL